MNIGFWGASPGKASVSSNMLAMATFASLKYQMELSVMQAQFNENRLEDAFMPISSMVCMKEDFAYYRREGIDEIIDNIRLGQGNNSLENALINVKNSQIYYLPSTSEANEELFERECEKEIERITNVISKCDKLNFIDCRDGRGVLSKALLSNADLIVFNLEQGLHSIPKKVFEDKALMEKCLFLVGRYDENSRYNVRTIRRKYHIDESCIAVIPYNIYFRDSVCEGKIIDYFNKNMNCDKDNDNYDFMCGVDNAVKMLFRKVGIGVKR